MTPAPAALPPMALAASAGRSAALGVLLARGRRGGAEGGYGLYVASEFDSWNHLMSILKFGTTSFQWLLDKIFPHLHRVLMSTISSPQL